MDSQMILEALERLGPEKVERGLAAFRQPQHNWQECFLALCYGPPGALAKQATCVSIGPTFDDLCRELGLTRPQVQAMVAAFDGSQRDEGIKWSYTGPEEGFEELVEGFLEAHRNAHAPVECDEVYA